MNFAEKLKAKAKETGQKVVQGKEASAKPKVEAKKAGSLKALGAQLKKAKKSEVKRGEIETEFTAGAVPTWSFSTLKKYENCPWAVKLGKVDRIPSESGEAAQRGSEIHDGCEAYVRGLRDDLPADGRTKFDIFADDFVDLKQKFRDGVVQLEEDWGIRKDWSPCDWDDPELWGKAKLDVFVRENEETCVIIDHKTGRKFGNEMKHADQGLSYALHTMHRYPEINIFKVEFWYLDEGEKMIRTFSRAQLKMLLIRAHNRAKKMTTATDFMPNANPHTCMFCEYGCNTNKAGKPYGNGACSYDAYKGTEDV